MRRIALGFVFAAIANCRATPVDQLIPWLLDEDRQLRRIPFSQVIVDVTGKVKLKAEFQGSNADIYRAEAIVASSANQKN
jgi:hypothetical protein